MPQFELSFKLLQDFQGFFQITAYQLTEVLIHHLLHSKKMQKGTTECMRKDWVLVQHHYMRESRKISYVQIYKKQFELFLTS